MNAGIIKDTISPRLAKLIKATKNPRPVLEAMGLSLVSITKRAFTEPALRPTAWAPRKQFGAAAANNPILIRSSLLRRSIRVVRVSDREVEVGTDRPYALAHQLGSKPYTIKPKGKKALFWPGAAHPVKLVRHPGLPPRPFFPFTAGGEMTALAKTRIRTVAEAKIETMAKA